MPERKEAEAKGLPRRSKLKELGPEKKSNDIDLMALVLLFVALVANVIVLLTLL